MSVSLPHGTGNGGRQSFYGRRALIVRRPALSSGARDPHHHFRRGRGRRDRKSTRLNSSHLVISYAVFCLKKKKNHKTLKRQAQRQVGRLEARESQHLTATTRQSYVY